MGVIVKYLVKNIWEKKLRTFLILMAIVLSSGVFFGSLSISDSVYDMIMEMVKGYFGNCDIIITASEKSTSQFFYTAKAKKYMDRFDYVIGETGGNAVYKPNRKEKLEVNLKGIDLTELQSMNPFVLEKQTDLYPFDGRKVVINSSIAKKYNLALGDVIDLEIGDSHKVKYKICGIAQPEGFFKSDGRTLIAVVPRESVAALFDSKGKVNIAYIKLKDPTQKKEAIRLLSEEYKNYRVAEPVPFEEIKKETTNISIIFMMLSCVVFFMSIFIIYSSFKVIAVERLPAIGTFRSMGATKRMANWLLLGESIAYGVTGGALGCLLGIGILYLMSFAMAGMINGDQGMARAEVKMTISAMNMGISYIMAVVLCLAGSIFPIVKVSKISVKDIVLNMVQKTKKNRKIKFILGILFILSTFALALVKQESMRPLAMGLGMITSMTGIVLLVPYFTRGAVRLLETPFERLFGNIGVLAAKNLRENKNLINNIAMLAIGISSLLMINTAGYDSAASAMDEYKNTKYDIEMYTWKMDRDLLYSVKNVDGVASVYGDYDFYRVDVLEKNSYISRLKGVDQSKFLDFWNLKLKGDQMEAFKQLDSGRNIMLSKVLKDMLMVDEGDKIRLKMRAGEREYTVVGFFDKLQSSSNVALISEKYAKMDMQAKEFTGLYIITSKSSEEVLKSLEDKFAARRPFIRTKEQSRDQWLNDNKRSMVLFSGFSIIASFIGVFGVINNLILSFMERKHSIAVLRSMGMSKRQTLRMIFLESATGGVVGGVIGIAGGILLIAVIAGASETNNIHFPVNQFGLYMAGGAIIMLLASISPALKSSKLNIIEEIKYE